MNKVGRIIIKPIFIIAIIWVALTIWAESKGGERFFLLGDEQAQEKVLIVYDPDPFYNLDEQVCKSFGELFAAKGFGVYIYSVQSAEISKLPSFDLFVFCANTYNWRPDMAVSDYIKNSTVLKNKPVVAITLGSGSTEASQRLLEKIISEKQARLIGSRSFWLLKPNDESKNSEPNVKVATTNVYEWAKELELKFHTEQSKR